MDFQIYESTENSSILLLNDSRSKHWNLTMENDEYFQWDNSLKIDTESKFESVEESVKTSRKRKLQDNATLSNNATKTKFNDCKGKNDPEVLVKKPQQNNTGSSRMPQWQMDDISELNADISGLAADHSNNSFNMSEAILSLSSMTVFKQEAPSPSNHDPSVPQFSKQNPPATVTTTQIVNPTTTVADSQNSAMLNTTLHQLLSQSGYNNIQNIDGNILNSPGEGLSQDGYGVTSSNSSFSEDSRFQYVLAAATSIATKINEDTLTYLNQGQSYEIKLKKLGDLSTCRGKLLKSVIRICFHERRLQYMEKEQMRLWQQSRPGDRILEVDVPLSYGLHDVIQPSAALNTIQFSWDPTKEVGAYIKVNCISTEFTPKKHGGEKGVPFRIQVETYQNAEGFDTPKCLHAAACQIKVFKLKGADRKHKQDREKILKRPISEQEKYQPSYECTVLNDVPSDALTSPTAGNGPYSPENVSQNNFINQQPTEEKSFPLSSSPTNSIEKVSEEPNAVVDDQISPTFSPQQITNWLTCHRFDKYLQTFTSFSGADMLRMSRDDLIQICGHADGIRLYNALHSKMITPMLTIYVSRDNKNIFSAVFLSSLSTNELVQKLANIISVTQDQIKDICVVGPKSIHVQLSSDVIKHIKDESMFNIDVLQDKGGYIIVLKPAQK